MWLRLVFPLPGQQTFLGVMRGDGRVLRVLGLPTSPKRLQMWVSRCGTAPLLSPARLRWPSCLRATTRGQPKFGRAGSWASSRCAQTGGKKKNGNTQQLYLTFIAFIPHKISLGHHQRLLSQRLHRRGDKPRCHMPGGPPQNAPSPHSSFIWPQNHSCWKRPPRSPSPTPESDAEI